MKNILFKSSDSKTASTKYYCCLRLLIICLFMLGVEGATAQNETISVIPQPESLYTTRAHFQLNNQTKIVVLPKDMEVLRIAKMLAEKIRTAAGLTIAPSDTDRYSAKNVILFTIVNEDSLMGEEGYRISVTDSIVVISATRPAGLFYGMQTLLQLLPAEIESPQLVKDVVWNIPGVEITDKPRFKWRGMHLDVCRHFMPVDFIKKYIDYMAMHKLNTFHWHLSDDQGWRLEIKQYPLLTKIGAWRKKTLIGYIKDSPRRFDNTPYGGFYTQDEAKEIVQYAKERFIRVVPEIEMPGHATAAIAAYPWLGVTGRQISVATYWGIFPDIFNVKDSTFQFLENVLTEVMDIFPDEYIHIGGDEAIKDQWKASRGIQQRIKELGLNNEHELQSYFVTRIERFINSRGRKMIGWDEILEGGLAPNATVMSWRGIEGGIAAARSRHDVIMTPIQSLYFWTYQGNPKTEPLAAQGYIPLKKVYEFEPVPSTLSAEEAQYVVGAQGCAWTEYMENPKKVEYMVFPRMSALAEVVWSSKNAKSWRHFAAKMPKQFKRYDYMGINYAKVPLSQ